MVALHDLTALQAATAIRSGELSLTELTEHYLDRIARLDGEIGAFVTVTAEVARAQAAQAERDQRDGAELGPLHGVPTAIKDLNLTAGVPTRMGSATMADFVPPLDDHVVRLLREAGTISLGKTATPEFGLPCYTETDTAPPARTPWDTAQTPRPIGWFCGSTDDPVDPAEDFERQKRFTPHTSVYNACGQPPASLPLHWTPDGLPVGVMLVGRPVGEAQLLALCAQLESAAPWSERHPPIWHR